MPFVLPILNTKSNVTKCDPLLKLTKTPSHPAAPTPTNCTATAASLQAALPIKTKENVIKVAWLPNQLPIQMIQWLPNLVN